MSKNIKNRVFALVLGIIICLNVVILSPRKTEAVVGEAIAGLAVGAAGIGVGPVVVISVLTVVAGAFIISVFDGPVPEGEDTDTIAADFANWVAENKQSEFNFLKNKIAFNVTSAGIDTMNFLADADTIGMLSHLFSEYCAEKGVLTSTGVSFSFSSSQSGIVYSDSAALYNAAVSLYQDYYSVSSVNRYLSDSNWGTPALVDNGTRCYITFVGGLNYSTNDSHQFFGAIACRDRFMDLTQLSNGRYKALNGSRVIVWTPFDNDSHGEYSYGFDLSQVSVLGYYYYDPSASVADAPCDVIDLGFSESLGRAIDNIGDSVEDIAAAIDQFIADQVAEDADSRVTHYPDGTTAVDDGVVTTFPGSVDEDGNIDTPDNVRTKPWDDVFSPPVPDVYSPEGSAADAPAGANTSFFSKILDWLKSFWTLLQKLLALIFVPDLTPFNTLKPDIQDKFGFVAQIAELWGQFTDSDFGSQRPDFKITIPASFLHSSNDVDCLIIDFSLFDQYRTILHHIIILLAYMAFFKRLLNDLPSLLGYVGGRSHTVVINNRNTYNY